MLTWKRINLAGSGKLLQTDWRNNYAYPQMSGEKTGPTKNLKKCSVSVEVISVSFDGESLLRTCYNKKVENSLQRGMGVMCCYEKQGRYEKKKEGILKIYNSCKDFNHASTNQTRWPGCRLLTNDTSYYSFEFVFKSRNKIKKLSCFFKDLIPLCLNPLEAWNSS